MHATPRSIRAPCLIFADLLYFLRSVTPIERRGVAARAMFGRMAAVRPSVSASNGTRKAEAKKITLDLDVGGRRDVTAFTIDKLTDEELLLAGDKKCPSPSKE